MFSIREIKIFFGIINKLQMYMSNFILKHKRSIILFIAFFLIPGCSRSISKNETGKISSITSSMTATKTIARETSTVSAPVIEIASTEVLYLLKVIVSSQDGEPIANAEVTLPLLSNSEIATQITNDQGVATWQSPTMHAIPVNVQASGYLPVFRDENLSPGENEIRITMLLDENALSPEQACRSEEKLLYSEDFQDSRTQGWSEIESGDSGGIIQKEDVNSGNFVLTVRNGENVQAHLSDHEFRNMVWRLKLRIGSKGGRNFNFRWHLTPIAHYEFGLADDLYNQPLLRITTEEIQELNNPHREPPQAGEWHLLELSFYEGLVWVFLDGEELTTYLDAKPLPGGSIGLDIQPGGGEITLDDFAVCEINAPFVPLGMP